MSQPRKKLPIGIQSFAKLRNEGCYYVDKTEFALLSWQVETLSSRF